MNEQYKIDMFSNELEYIKDERIKIACMKALTLLPDYFFTVQASSTGKYHPPFALGENGLVRHSKAAVKVAHDILNNDKGLVDAIEVNDFEVLREMYENIGISYIEISNIVNSLNGDTFSDKEKDLLIMATMIHDGLKHGKEENRYTKHNHPDLMADYMKEIGTTIGLTKDETDYVSDVIKTHMGPFISTRYDKTVLTPATTKEQLLVFISDYASSRKYIPIYFDENNNVINNKQKTK